MSQSLGGFTVFKLLNRLPNTLTSHNSTRLHAGYAETCVEIVKKSKIRLTFLLTPPWTTVSQILTLCAILGD